VTADWQVVVVCCLPFDGIVGGHCFMLRNMCVSSSVVYAAGISYEVYLYFTLFSLVWVELFSIWVSRGLVVAGRSNHCVSISKCDC
jgi:hypothetical protein